MKKRLNTHWLELLLGIIFLFLALYLNELGLSKEASWIIGVMGALISVSIIILKLYIRKALEEIESKRINGEGQLIDSLSILNDLDESKYRYSNYILGVFHKQIKSIAKGIIDLTPSRYYVEIIDNIKSSKLGDEVYAVNCINEIRWSESARQINYLDENLIAAQRGVKIHRIFIVDKQRLTNSDDYRQRIELIRQQQNTNNIEVSIVWSQELNDDKKRIRDWVLFKNKGESRLYEGRTNNFNGFNVDKAILYLNQEEINRAERDFKVLLKYKIKKEVWETMNKTESNDIKPDDISTKEI